MDCLGLLRHCTVPSCGQHKVCGLKRFEVCACCRSTTARFLAEQMRFQALALSFCGRMTGTHPKNGGHIFSVFFFVIFFSLGSL